VRRQKNSQGSQRKKDQKIAKQTPKNSAFKPLSTIFLQCMKIQGGGTAPLLPAADAHGYITETQICFPKMSLEANKSVNKDTMSFLILARNSL